MENQHRKITGYKELDQEQIDLMNEIKAKERELAELRKKVIKWIVGTKPDSLGMLTPDGENNMKLFQESMRQAAISRTEFEHGFMVLTKSVARLESPWIE